MWSASECACRMLECSQLSTLHYFNQSCQTWSVSQLSICPPPGCISPAPILRTSEVHVSLVNVVEQSDMEHLGVGGQQLFAARDGRVVE